MFNAELIEKVAKFRGIDEDPTRNLSACPALVLNAINDPFIPATSLPRRGEVGPAVTLWQPPEGGHVGFPSGGFPGHVADLPEAVGRWLRQQL